MPNILFNFPRVYCSVQWHVAVGDCGLVEGKPQASFHDELDGVAIGPSNRFHICVIEFAGSSGDHSSQPRQYFRISPSFSQEHSSVTIG